jgi:hypothetical protein
MGLPRWIEPRLSKLAAKAPTGPQRVHEIKSDLYRMAVPISSKWKSGGVKTISRATYELRALPGQGTGCPSRLAGDNGAHPVVERSPF